MAKLAIKGHSSRGKEVIEILEMLGGKNKAYINGTDTDLVYYIYPGGRPFMDGEQYKPNLEKENCRSVELPIEWFPEVTFENSPQEVEIKLVK